MNKEYQLNQKNREIEFLKFIENEGFIRTIDKIGNFQSNQPLFYKKIGENNFIAFNIPFYYQNKNDFFQSDFWRISVKNESDFLNKKLNNNEYKDIILGFRIERDMELYSREINIL